MISDTTIHLLADLAMETVDRDCPGLREHPHRRSAAIFRVVHLMLQRGAYEQDGRIMLPEKAPAC